MGTPGLRKYALLIAYRGTSYCGWQRQSGPADHGDPSIQGTIEAALRRITGEETITVVGSGRTDSGVHAMGQVAHFVLRGERVWDPHTLFKGLNGILPSSIRIQGAQAVPIEFHAQQSAHKKQYSYYFQQGPCSLPHLEPHSWWIRKPLDLEAMREALGTLRGQHDFKPFQATGGPLRSTVREILEAEVEWQPIPFPGQTPISSGPVGLARVRIVGTGFLKQMVRGIAGTLLQIGEGRRPVSTMREILDSGDRSQVGPTAPGRALWLERVWYDDLHW